MFVITAMSGRKSTIPSSWKLLSSSTYHSRSAGGDRIGETLSDVASDGYVVSCRTEDFARHGGRGGLAVGTGDADGLSFRIASGELDFGDDRYVPFSQLHHNGGRFRNAGTFDSQVGVEYPGFGVRALLVGDAVTV